MTLARSWRSLADTDPEIAQAIRDEAAPAEQTASS